jgi:hypothetical protein
MEHAMKLGVLLLSFKDTADLRVAKGRNFTHFTQDWAHRAIGRVAQYFLAQSGGRQTISFKVFDWIPLPKTEDEWVELGFGAYDALRNEIEQIIGESLDPFTHILVGLDHTESRGGATTQQLAQSFTYLNAAVFTPSNIAHELGHRFHPQWPLTFTPDAFGETDSGEAIYQNRFCVMGARPWAAVFADDAIPDPTGQMLNQSGPGMSAPTLLATGWLKEDAHATAVHLSDNNLFSSGGAVLQLSALSGAPGPAWGRPPVMARYNDLVIEYRVGASHGWDRGLPDPGPGAGGWVVVHRSIRSTPRALYVSSVPAKPGAVLSIGNDSPFDLFNPGPVKISVLSFDASARTVSLGLSRRAAKQLPSSTSYGGVTVGGGGLVWTPGRGVTPVPPRSPLITVLEAVARIQALQDMMAVASRDEMDGLSREATVALHSLERSVTGLRVETSVSPLAQVLESVSRLHNASETIANGASIEDEEAARQFIATSRRQLAEMREILARAVEEERRP